MGDALDHIERRLAVAERTLRRTRVLFVGALTALATFVVGIWLVTGQRQEILRAKAIVIEDGEGRERIVLGAPIPEPPGARFMPSTGIIIRDRDGFERFGVGLFPNGLMNMGFDAPPGRGDDRNRERVNISAEPDGGAEIRVLDRETWVRARLILDPENKVALDFLDFPTGEMVRRRFSINGAEFHRETRP